MAVLALAPPAMAGPINLSPPGTPDRSGRTLSTGTGSWLLYNGPFSYAWERCNSAGAGCATVSGRTASTYLLTTADVGRRIGSIVTATNGSDPSSAVSPLTATIVAAPPVNQVPPAVTGTPRAGSALSSTLGVWSDPSPANVTYRRQWQRCTAGAGFSCQSISRATGASYTSGPADEGQFLRVLVSAEGLGTSLVGSPPVGPVTSPPAPDGGGEGPGGGSPGGGEAPGGGGNTTPPAGGLRKMRPFPRLVIAGRLARGLTFISGLAIRRGPRGATVTVRCRGRGCPRGAFRKKLSRRGTLQLKRFQRIYGPGTVIEIRITKGGAIGKYTRLTVRPRSIPSRRDACLRPGSSKPARCPAR